MQAFVKVRGVAVPLAASNIDTDVIMPKQFLKGIDRSGLDRGLFYHLRFDEQGGARPEFILNRPQWRDAAFLIAGANFGCGSSREHAVWGLMQYGIRAIVAESFAGIFFDNCARNGLLAIELGEPDVRRLQERAGLPSMSTVHAPQAPSLQPSLTEVRRSSSRRKRSSVPPDFGVTDCPLTVNVAIAAPPRVYFTKYIIIRERRQSK